VHVYPSAHYPYWREQLGMELPFGSFGENITLSGVDEAAVCIGDLYRAGTVLLQVSEPRQPCYKLAMRFGQPKLPLWFREQGFTGFYLRVLEEGELQQGQSFRLVARQPAPVTIRAAYTASFDKEANWEQRVCEALRAEALGEDWRKLLESRLRGR
jgi:MOSC domain-containing protein YiiM